MTAVPNRHPGVTDALRWLDSSHLPPHLQEIVAPIEDAAHEMVQLIGTDSPQLTTGLNLMVQAKDALVRAKIVDQEAEDKRLGR